MTHHNSLDKKLFFYSLTQLDLITASYLTKESHCKENYEHRVKHLLCTNLHFVKNAALAIKIKYRYIYIYIISIYKIYISFLRKTNAA